MEFSSQNSGVGNLSLLQGIFPTQGSSAGILRCRRILCQLSHKGSSNDQVQIFSRLELTVKLVTVDENLPQCCGWPVYPGE